MTAASTIADELLDIVNQVAGCLSLPRVARVWLPRDLGNPRRSAEFGALVLEDGSVGLFYVLLEHTRTEIASLGSQGSWAGRNPADIARGFRSAEPAEKALGLGAVNAISQHTIRVSGLPIDTETSSMASFDPQPEDRIGMVGFFPPLVERLRSRNIDLTVIELKPSLVQEHERYRVTLDPTALRRCNKILCTSTILLNDSIDSLLAFCEQAEHVAIIGPSAGFLPDPLFARGIDTVGGHQVLDAEGFIARCEAEKKWGQTSRKYCIHRQSYPGFRELLERETS